MIIADKRRVSAILINLFTKYAVHDILYTEQRNSAKEQLPEELSRVHSMLKAVSLKVLKMIVPAMCGLL